MLAIPVFRVLRPDHDRYAYDTESGYPGAERAGAFHVERVRPGDLGCGRTSCLLAEGRCLRDRAVAIDGRGVTLALGDVLEPDYLVLATGSAYPFPAKTEEPDIASARARHRAAHEALLAADRALIVGAGPSGLDSTTDGTSTRALKWCARAVPATAAVMACVFRRSCSSI